MKYADGVIQTAETVNPALLEYINNNKIKFLPYQGDVDESADAINSFYDTL